MENLFKTVNATLALYERNFKMMHWKAVGCRFDYIHDKAEEFAELMRSVGDTVTEIGLIYAINPVNCDHIMDVLSEDTLDHGIISPEMNIDYDKFYTNTFAMLENVCKLLNQLREEADLDDDPGLCSMFDEAYGKVCFELRYKHVRRLAKEEAPGTVEEIPAEGEGDSEE